MKNKIFIKLAAFLKLVRWFHEVAVILPFTALYLVIRFYAQKNNINCNLPGFDFFLLCVCVQSLIAAGCVLNDILDRHIDKINKPRTHVVGNAISLKTAWRIFYAISVFIFILSFYISVYVFYQWAYISVTVYFLSLLYDFYFKRSPFMGNILMAILTAFIPLVLLFFAKDCIATLHNQKINILIYLYAALPFMIIIPRELSLDISDMEGDKACGCKTLPIVIGVKKSRIVVLAFLIAFILLSIPVVLKYNYLFTSFLFIDILLIYYIFLFQKTKTRIEYIRIGRFLWFIMIVGLIAFTISTVI